MRHWPGYLAAKVALVAPITPMVSPETAPTVWWCAGAVVAALVLVSLYRAGQREEADS